MLNGQYCFGKKLPSPKHRITPKIKLKTTSEKGNLKVNVISPNERLVEIQIYNKNNRLIYTRSAQLSAGESTYSFEKTLGKEGKFVRIRNKRGHIIAQLSE